jgi:protease I
MTDGGTASNQGSRNKRVGCLLSTDFEESEFQVPRDRLRAAGYEVVVIGFKAGETLTGKKGRETVTVDLGIDDVHVGDYEGLLIPGGYSPDKLRSDDRFVAFVIDFDATERPLGAVCHGPQLLLTAELQRGRRMTAWETVQGDLRQAGAYVDDRPVVVDHNWITSRKPEDLAEFSAKLIEELRELEERGGWRSSSMEAAASSAAGG